MSRERCNKQTLVWQTESLEASVPALSYRGVLPLGHSSYLPPSTSHLARACTALAWAAAARGLDHGLAAAVARWTYSLAADVTRRHWHSGQASVKMSGGGRTGRDGAGQVLHPLALTARGAVSLPPPALRKRRLSAGDGRALSALGFSAIHLHVGTPSGWRLCTVRVGGGCRGSIRQRGGGGSGRQVQRLWVLAACAVGGDTLAALLGAWGSGWARCVPAAATAAALLAARGDLAGDGGALI